MCGNLRAPQRLAIATNRWQGQFEAVVFCDSRALLHTPALFLLDDNLGNKCQTAFSKLALSDTPFKAFQLTLLTQLDAQTLRT